MKKKVLHIHTLPIISGSGINTFLSMKFLDKNKYVVSLACAPKGKLENLVKESGFEFIPVNNLVNPVNPLKDIAALIELVKIIRKGKFDIIHTHNSKAGFIGRVAGRIAGAKKIVHTVHGFAFHNREKFIWRNIFLLLEKIAVHFCDELIFISEPLINWGKKYNIYLPEHTYKIYSGIELSKFNISKKNDKLREEFNISKNDFVIGEVAKLWKGKGHFTILKSAILLKEKIKNLKVVFIGEGYLKSEIEKFIKKNKMDDYVILVGFRVDIENIIHILDISLLISSFEGMGRVVLESFASQIPVIATRVGGIIELITDSYNGFLIEPDDINGLVDRVQMLYYDKNLRERFIKNSFELITEKFSAEKMVKDIELVYEK